jgi:hypothetical protein
MRRAVDRGIFYTAALAMVCGYWALPAAGVYSPAVMVLPVLMLAYAPLGERLDRAHRGYRTVTFALTLAYTLFLPFSFGMLGRFGGVMALIMFVLAHKMAHRRAPRDYYQVFLMAFFLVLSACTRAPGSSIAPLIFLFMASAVAGFALLHVRRVLERSGDQGLAGVVAAAGNPTPETPGLRRHGYAGWVGAVFVASLIATAALFIFTPRMQAGVIQREEDIEEATTGVGTDVDLDFSGQIEPDSSIVMRVEFPEEPEGRYEGELFWRVTAYDEYTGSRWEDGGVALSAYDQARDVTFEPGERRLSRSATQRGRLVRQSVFLGEVPESGLPALPLVKDVTCEDVNLGWAADGDFTVLAVEPRSRLSYEAWSEVRTTPEETLRQARRSYRFGFDRDEYRHYTRHFLSQASVALTQSIVDGTETPYEAAEAIAAWLQSDAFEYDINVPEYNSRNPVDQFLLEGRTGHCQLFASAMALMLRSIGVPSRIVVGYRGGEWDQGDRSYVVRNSMAHAWVEMYVLDHGWVTFDPSPEGDAFDHAAPWLARVASRLQLRADLWWYQNVINYRSAVTLEGLRAMAAGVFMLPARLGDWFTDFDGMPAAPEEFATLLLWAALVVVVAGVSLRAAWRLPARHDAPGLTADQARARKLYRRFRRTAEKRGVAVAGKTARELLGEVRNQPGADAAAATRLVDAYNRVRFGGGDFSRSEYGELRRLAGRLFPAD